MKSAQNLAGENSSVDLYSEDSGSGKTYDDLLARDDIQAVIIAYVNILSFFFHYHTGELEGLTIYCSLPIPIQPEFVRKALSAGKHVLSEKPISQDIAAAQELIKWYESNIDTSKVFWGVAENYRYMRQYVYAAEQIRKLGRVKNFRVNMHTKVQPDSKYYCGLRFC